MILCCSELLLMMHRLESSYEQLAGMKADIEAKIQQAKEKEAARR